MQSNILDSRKSNGSVGIENFQGRLRLRLPRQLYAGKQKYLTLGLDDTSANRTYADAKKSQIELDILSGNFDPTLAKYRHQTHLRVVDGFTEPIKNFSLDELWERYTELRSQQVSVTTLRLNYARVASHIKKLPTKNLDEAIAIRDYLIQSNSAYTTKRILVQLAACCKWAAKSKLISDNPFAQMATEIRVSDDNKAEKIDPFSREERDIVIEAFENHPKYKHYAPFVKFLFWTGCRTSEAVGLQWKHISEDCRTITFSEAVVNVSSQGIRKDTKTHKARKFPANERLVELLQSIKTKNYHPENTVFPSITGKLINSHTFNADVWKGCKRHGKQVDGIVTKLAKEGKIDHYRPQYQTRHTFITLVLEAGISPKDVARWVGNSPEIIMRHYAGANRNLAVPEV